MQRTITAEHPISAQPFGCKPDPGTPHSCAQQLIRATLREFGVVHGRDRGGLLSHLQPHSYWDRRYAKARHYPEPAAAQMLVEDAGREG